jgi:outer membrane biosynthesis protein TonB
MRAASPISVAQTDPYVRRIAGVCDMHRVAVGSLAELEGFLKALDEDKHLAMDFWAVMGKMSDEGSAYLAGRTLNAKMLEVVVEAVTGVSVADILAAGEHPRHVVAQLVRLLAGEDIHSPVVVDDGPDVEAATPDVESRKPVARAETPPPAPTAGAGSASSLRPFRYSAGEVERSERSERSPVEMRPVHREGDEVPAADVVKEEAGPGQRAAAGRESVKGTPIRWPSDAAAAEPFVQQPVQQPFAPQREVPRASGPESIARARAAFTGDAPPAGNKPAAGEDEELERLRLVHWVLKNFPAAQGGAAAQAEADYYGTKLTAAEIFARYAEHLARVQESPAKERTIAERPAEGDRVGDRTSQAGRMVEGAEAAKLAYWRLPEGAVDPNAPVVHHPKAEVLQGKVEDNDRLVRVPLSDYEDDEEEVDRQRRVFKVVLSGIVVVGILVGLLLAQIHVVDGWRNLRASIHDQMDAMTHRNRSALNIPNDLVVDPEPTPPAPLPPVRRVVRPPQTQPQARSVTPAKPSFVDRPLVRVLPAPSDRIDPVPGARAGVAYDTVLSSNGAGSGSGSGSVPVGPVVVPAATMEANLISSRLPIYPEGARVGDGRVVLQAIISKSGTVGHLRVLSGDPALRGAAADAVAKWRYRPYIVNYQPVEVSTTVIVDFNRGQ